MRTILASVFSCVFILATLAGAEEGVCMRVKDGDTAVIRSTDGKVIICRLYGIDAPETAKGKRPGQPYGERSFAELKKLIEGKRVTVTTSGQQHRGREICRIYNDGLDVNLEMVKRGAAWAYVQYLKRPHVGPFLDAERSARQQHLGIWEQHNPQPPWEFRSIERQRTVADDNNYASGGGACATINLLHQKGSEASCLYPLYL